MNELKFYECVIRGFCVDMAVLVATIVVGLILYVIVSTSGMDSSTGVGVGIVIFNLYCLATPMLFIFIVVGNIKFKGVWPLFFKLLIMSIILAAASTFMLLHWAVSFTIWLVFSGIKYQMTYKHMKSKNPEATLLV